MTEAGLGCAEQHQASARLRLFVLWLAAFYAIWLTIVATGNLWDTVARNWGIAVAMAAGSYVAGSTPMGGGTVGFPILVLLFDEPGVVGRDFSFAIQSIGMVSASILILCMRSQVEWSLLLAAMIGSLAGTPIGVVFLAPRIDDLTVKLLFTVIWASFGLMHLVRGREIIAVQGMTRHTPCFDRLTGLAVGAIGGATVAAVTGVGIDMMVYTVLVLLARADVKIAIRTSVILMAFTSVVGMCTIAFGWGAEDRGSESAVFAYWLAAAPVVAIGAPIGALIVSLIPRGPTLVFVSLLCLGQFIWTCIHERVTGATLAVSVAAVLLLNLAFHVLYDWGKRQSRRLGRDPSFNGSAAT